MAKVVEQAIERKANLLGWPKLARRPVGSVGKNDWGWVGGKAMLADVVGVAKIMRKVVGWVAGAGLLTLMLVTGAAVTNGAGAGAASGCAILVLCC